MYFARYSADRFSRANASCKRSAGWSALVLALGSMCVATPVYAAFIIPHDESSFRNVAADQGVVLDLESFEVAVSDPIENFTNKEFEHGKVTVSGFETGNIRFPTIATEGVSVIGQRGGRGTSSPIIFAFDTPIRAFGIYILNGTSGSGSQRVDVAVNDSNGVSIAQSYGSARFLPSVAPLSPAKDVESIEFGSEHFWGIVSTDEGFQSVDFGGSGTSFADIWFDGLLSDQTAVPEPGTPSLIVAVSLALIAYSRSSPTLPGKVRRSRA